MEQSESENIQNVADAITVHLAGKIGQCIQTMCGQFCAVAATPNLEKGVAYGGMVVIVPFFGTAQGYCIMAMDERVAAGLLEAHLRSMSMPQEATRASRDQYTGLCQEILNVAVGETIVDLERHLGDLTYFPSLVIFGEIVFPRLLTARVPLSTAKGTFNCGFMLDMAKPKLAKKLKKIVEDLSQKTLESRTDGLTKVYNRSFFEQRLRQEIDSAGGKENLGILMVDLDNLKEINDAHGHGCGDEALKVVAEALRTSIADKDFAGRYGGDEFIVACCGKTAKECVDVAERIRSSIVESVACCPEKRQHAQVRLSVSMGITNFLPDDTYDELISRADKLLYSAKRAGRNMYVCG